MPERVVCAAAVGIGEHLIGLGRLLELLLGLGIVLVDVRMELARQPPEGLLDLRVAGSPVDTEDLVVVALIASLVDRLEEAGQLARRAAYRDDRRRVVHAEGPDHPDGPEVAVAEPVVGADHAHRAKLRGRVLIPDPEEHGALVEGGAQDPSRPARRSSARISASTRGRSAAWSSERRRAAPST